MLCSPGPFSPTTPESVPLFRGCCLQILLLTVPTRVLSTHLLIYSLAAALLPGTTIPTGERNTLVILLPPPIVTQTLPSNHTERQAEERRGEGRGQEQKPVSSRASHTTPTERERDTLVFTTSQLFSPPSAILTFSFTFSLFFSLFFLFPFEPPPLLFSPPFSSLSLSLT